jgi:hypothetical protein
MSMADSYKDGDSGATPSSKGCSLDLGVTLRPYVSARRWLQEKLDARGTKSLWSISAVTPLVFFAVWAE